jgi:predicted metal-binding membrane protein
MKSNRIVGTVLVLVAGIAVASTAWADHHEKSPGGKAGGGHAMHEAMRQQMKAQDERLDALVAAMNAAEGAAKVDAIAAVVNEMVDQRRTRRAHHEAMRGRRQGKGGMTSKKQDAN